MGGSQMLKQKQANNLKLGYEKMSKEKAKVILEESKLMISMLDEGVEKGRLFYMCNLLSSVIEKEEKENIPVLIGNFKELIAELNSVMDNFQKSNSIKNFDAKLSFDQMFFEFKAEKFDKNDINLDDKTEEPKKNNDEKFEEFIKSVSKTALKVSIYLSILGLTFVYIYNHLILFLPDASILNHIPFIGDELANIFKSIEGLFSVLLSGALSLSVSGVLTKISLKVIDFIKFVLSFGFEVSKKAYNFLKETINKNKHKVKSKEDKKKSVKKLLPLPRA